MSEGRLERRAAMATLLAGRGDDLLVVPGLGSTCWDLAAAGDNDRNFYLWGAMGGAAMIGLGLALAQPDKRVAVVTGDGEMLMGLGAFATIGAQRPANLSILILDNGLYEETGAQPTHTAMTTDLAAVARACGIEDAQVVTDTDGVQVFSERAHRVGNAPALAVARIAPSNAPKVLPSRDGAWLRARMRASFGLAPL
jgi:thiamine pyrophosphate-dependent acetolactate synthase large subunit-like protein